MDERENASYWERNADEWTRLVRRGYDTSRDFVNSPAFFKLLPDVRGLRGFDLGCGDYFRELDGEIERWTFGAARRDGLEPKDFHIPRFTHTLETWLNMFLDTGFVLERFCEPTVDDATLARDPDRLYDARIIAYFL